PRMSARFAGGASCATEPPVTVKNLHFAVFAKGATSSSELSAPFGAIIVRYSPSLPGTAIEALNSYRTLEYRNTGVPRPALPGKVGVTRTVFPFGTVVMLTLTQSAGS